MYSVVPLNVCNASSIVPPTAPIRSKEVTAAKRGRVSCTDGVTLSIVTIATLLLQRVQYLALRIGKAPALQLGVDETAVAQHLERATRAFDDGRVDAELRLDRGSQTGRPGVVPSSLAVFDANVHERESNVDGEAMHVAQARSMSSIL